jgi:hypothetical protein
LRINKDLAKLNMLNLSLDGPLSFTSSSLGSVVNRHVMPFWTQVAMNIFDPAFFARQELPKYHDGVRRILKT